MLLVFVLFFGAYCWRRNTRDTRNSMWSSYVPVSTDPYNVTMSMFIPLPPKVWPPEFGGVTMMTWDETLGRILLKVYDDSLGPIEFFIDPTRGISKMQISSNLSDHHVWSDCPVTLPDDMILLVGSYFHYKNGDVKYSPYGLRNDELLMVEPRSEKIVWSYKPDFDGMITPPTLYEYPDTRNLISIGPIFNRPEHTRQMTAIQLGTTPPKVLWNSVPVKGQYDFADSFEYMLDDNATIPKIYWYNNSQHLIQLDVKTGNVENSIDLLNLFTPPARDKCCWIFYTPVITQTHVYIYGFNRLPKQVTPITKMAVWSFSKDASGVLTFNWVRKLDHPKWKKNHECKTPNVLALSKDEKHLFVFCRRDEYSPDTDSFFWDLDATNGESLYEYEVPNPLSCASNPVIVYGEKGGRFTQYCENNLWLFENGKMKIVKIPSEEMEGKIMGLAVDAKECFYVPYYAALAGTLQLVKKCDLK